MPETPAPEIPVITVTLTAEDLSKPLPPSPPADLPEHAVAFPLIVLDALEPGDDAVFLIDPRDHKAYACKLKTGLHGQRWVELAPRFDGESSTLTVGVSGRGDP